MNARDVVLDYLAIGLDPEKVALYMQSSLPEVAELAWIFNCITTMPTLMRAHAFKDAEAKRKDINVGTFDYPILMAADILIQNPDVVPVGKDQAQHVEMSREIAQKFNHHFGETFKIPELQIKKEVAVVPGIDGEKMSKSYGNTIPLFGTDDEIRAQVAKIVTDSKTPEEPKDPETDHIFALHKLFSQDQLADIEKRYKEGGVGYKESKDILAENIIKMVTPMRERRAEFEKDTKLVDEILEKGTERARERALPLMEEIRKKVGLK